MTTELSRRSAIAALAGSAAFAGTFAAPATAALVDVSEGKARIWAAALAEYEAAHAARNEFEPEWRRVFEAYDSSAPTLDCIPWREFPFENREEVARVMDVEKRWTFFLKGQGKWWWAPGKEEARKAQYRAALDAVLEFRRMETEHEVNSGMTAADEISARLQDRFDRAQKVLRETPAPHRAALLWKMENLWPGDEEDGRHGPVAGSILADARRLLSDGRA